MSYEGYSPKINPTSSLFSNMMYHPGKWIKAHHIQAGHTVAFTGSMAGAGGIIFHNMVGDSGTTGPGTIVTLTGSGSINLDPSEGFNATSGSLYEFSIQEVTTNGCSATVLMSQTAATKP